MSTRVALDRPRVVQEIRAAAPLMADLAAPVTARAPWLTAVLNHQAAHHRPGVRPAAVVVAEHRHDRPDAVAFLTLRRRCWVTEVTLLGQSAGPLPPGRAPSRLLARGPDLADRLAGGICDLLDSLRGPTRLRLSGLPVGDLTARALAARQPDGVIGTGRSVRLVDGLDDAGPAVRSRDPRVLESWLPRLLAHGDDPRAGGFLRAAARLHAAIGQVEVAVVADGAVLRAGLLTLVEGADRWPWWGWTTIGGLSEEMGAPLVSLTAPARRWP
ncbi:hypothetical protein [Blastococcus sp. CT_GayMR20]|uniref:hypothetical protein n=1 Tax=Blastococcus sp. CT_GayMR20 TaxID=2559609 RepID=UPI001FD80C18|nr:hypothetical protein [Blastococcus sp. CT_GayMR20]